MNALEHALLGVNWYVNTQIVNKKPWWDNNHGRFFYTRNIKTGQTVLGICWTQARGIMCCLAAYERTKKKLYLETAERAAEYIMQLQILDNRDKRFFGAIHEEIYSSEQSNVRDAAECCLALAFLYRTTKNKEYLYRAEIWADWFLKFGLDKKGYPLSGFNLVTGKAAVSGHSFSGACAMALFALYQATKKNKYKAGFKGIVDEFVKQFFRKEDNTILVGTFASHHAGVGAEKGVALNDDGNGITLLQACLLLKDKKYLEMAMGYGDYLLAQKVPYGIYSAHPSRFNFLMDLAHFTGDKKYSDHVFKHIPTLLQWQDKNVKDSFSYGAFHGEDEPAEWYGPKNGKPLDFVNNRMTAYSVLTLFKMEGKVVGPYYSALAW